MSQVNSKIFIAGRLSHFRLDTDCINTRPLIIDYSVGLPGSQYNATAWQETHIAQEHASILGANAWIWVDSAYPLQTWCQSQYKKYEAVYHP